MNSQAIEDLRTGNCHKLSSGCVCKSSYMVELVAKGYARNVDGGGVMITSKGYARAKEPEDSALFIEELERAARDLRAVPEKEKSAIEALTGFSFNAIATYTERAAARLKILGENS